MIKLDKGFDIFKRMSKSRLVIYSINLILSS